MSVQIGYVDLPATSDVGEKTRAIIESGVLAQAFAGAEPEQILASELLSGMSRIHYAYEVGNQHVLLVGEEGDALFFLDSASHQLKPIASLHRWASIKEKTYDPGGLYWVELSELDGSVLVRYECGILRVDLNGAVRWQREHTCFASFSGIHSGVIWYQADAADYQTERFGYRLETGEQVYE